MNKYVVETEFMHNGLRCVVIFTSMGHRCGYVGITEGHPLYGVQYNSKVPGLNVDEKTPIGKRGVFSILLSDGTKDIRPELYFDVHGSLTYSCNEPEYPVPASGTWWFGFDCGHCDDSSDLEALDRYDLDSQGVRAYAEMTRNRGTVRSLQYVIDECKRLADQLVAVKENIQNSTADSQVIQSDTKSGEIMMK